MRTNHDTEVLHLQTSVVPVPDHEVSNPHIFKERISGYIREYISYDNGCLYHELQETPVYVIRPDQLNKLLHGFARSNFWANRKKNLIKLGGAYVQ